jgi:hypothetical protein
MASVWIPTDVGMTRTFAKVGCTRSNQRSSKRELQFSSKAEALKVANPYASRTHQPICPSVNWMTYGMIQSGGIRDAVQSQYLNKVVQA